MKKLIILAAALFVFGCLGGNGGPLHMGMRQNEVVEAWGRPMKIYRTVGSWGTHEQWRYGIYGIATGSANFKYLYFENGVLKSISY